jgi:transcriptional regulator with XRE-family HTH domain
LNSQLPILDFESVLLCYRDFGEIRSMARAGKALKFVLIRYGISQNQLATAMGIDRSNVSRWVSESRDPSAEAVAQIKQALNRLQPAAAEEFVQVYLYEGLDRDTSASDIAGQDVGHAAIARSVGAAGALDHSIAVNAQPVNAQPDNTKAAHTRAGGNYLSHPTPIAATGLMLGATMTRSE